MPDNERPSSSGRIDAEQHHDNDNPPAFPSDTASVVAPDNASEILPSYSPPLNDPQLPSYARATGAPSIAPRRRSVQTMTPEERMASLEAFIASKMEVNDTGGGRKGEVEGPPNNPLKPFKWMRRKMNSEKDVWRKMTDEERKKWEEDPRGVNTADNEQTRIW